MWCLVPRETTSVRRYDEILAGWQPTGLVGHFPPTIPAGARHVRLSFFPGFLQGGAYFQVRMQLAPAEIRTIEAQMKQAADEWDQRCAELGDDDCDREELLLMTPFHTADPRSGQTVFPSDYVLYLLHAEDHGGNWNHGQTAGVAISAQRNEVVYWAEAW